MSELRVSDILQYIVFIIMCRWSPRTTPTTLAAESMILILNSTTKLNYPSLNTDTGFYDMLVANVPADERCFLSDKKEVSQIVDALFSWCQSKATTKDVKHNKGKGYKSPCVKSLTLYEELLNLRPSTNFEFDTKMAQEFIQAASLFGLLPLGCMNSSCIVSEQDDISLNIAKLTGETDLARQREIFDSTVTFLKKRISSQATEVFIENITKVQLAPDYTKDAYYYLPHKRRAQYFYRLKKGSSWELKILRDPASTKLSKTVTLTKWKDGDSKFIHWVKRDRLEKDSKLKIPSHLYNEFFKPETVREEHQDRLREP